MLTINDAVFGLHPDTNNLVVFLHVWFVCDFCKRSINDAVTLPSRQISYIGCKQCKKEETLTRIDFEVT